MTFARLILVVLLSSSAVVGAQNFEIPDWENSVKFALVASQKPVRPGDNFELALVAYIEDGYHLYGPEEQEPSRTDVAVQGIDLSSGEPEYPPAIRRELSGLGEYDLYEGQVAIRVPVTLQKRREGRKPRSASHSELPNLHRLCLQRTRLGRTRDRFADREGGRQSAVALPGYLHEEITSSITSWILGQSTFEKG